MKKFIPFILALCMAGPAAAQGGPVWYRYSAASCQSLTDGQKYDQCKQDDGATFVCVPSGGEANTCDTSAEWVQVPGLALNFAWTGYHNYSGGALRMPEKTVAGLPAAASSSGKVYVVTDSASAGNCTTGSGSTRSICRSNGSSWEAIGGGGGSSITTSASLASLLTDETGSGVAVFGTSPSLTTPAIAGATVTGTVNASAAKLELPNGTAATTSDCDEAAEAGRIWVDTDATSGQQVYVCEGTSGWVLQGDGDSGTNTAANDIGDATADGTIALAGYKITETSTLNSAGAVRKISNTTADLTADVSLLDLTFTDDGDANGYYLRGYDNSAADLKWSISADGVFTGSSFVVSGTAPGSMTLAENTSNGTESITISAPASLTADRNCTLQDTGAPIPDSCVGDGVDGGGTAMLEVPLPVQSAKITGAFVTDGDATQGAQRDCGGESCKLLFDATTDEGAVWGPFRLPNNYASDPLLKFKYSAASATSGTVEFEGAIMCVSDGDSVDLDTASFSTIAVASATVPGTAGYPDALTITLTDDASPGACAAGDTAWAYLSTDADDGTNNTAAGDREVRDVSLSYTGS